MVRGLDDDVRIDLGGNVSIICEVMDIGTAEDALTYVAVLTGEELIKFMRKFCLDRSLEENIKPENRYELTAYDW